jgi:hypothetical protein
LSFSDIQSGFKDGRFAKLSRMARTKLALFSTTERRFQKSFSESAGRCSWLNLYFLTTDLRLKRSKAISNKIDATTSQAISVFLIKDIH